MKNIRACALWMLAGVLAGTPSRANEGFWRTRVELKLIALNEPAAKPLLLRLMASATGVTALKELDELVSAEKAELVDYQYVVLDAGTSTSKPPRRDVLAAPVEPGSTSGPINPATEGGRAQSEATMEWRYPTDFEPPKEPQTFGVSQPNPEPWRTDNQFVFNSFETRNLLGSMEVEAFVRPGGRVIDLGLVAGYVEFERFDFYPGGINPWGTSAGNVQPLFRNSRMRTHLHVGSGQSLLLASFAQQEPAPRILFFILKATATRP